MCMFLLIADTIKCVAFIKLTDSKNNLSQTYIVLSELLIIRFCRSELVNEMVEHCFRRSGIKLFSYKEINS